MNLFPNVQKNVDWATKATNNLFHMGEKTRNPIKKQSHPSESNHQEVERKSIINENQYQQESNEGNNRKRKQLLKLIVDVFFQGLKIPFENSKDFESKAANDSQKNIEELMQSLEEKEKHPFAVDIRGVIGAKLASFEYIIKNYIIRNITSFKEIQDNAMYFINLIIDNVRDCQEEIKNKLKVQNAKPRNVKNIQLNIIWLGKLYQILALNLIDKKPIRNQQTDFSNKAMKNVQFQEYLAKMKKKALSAYQQQFLEQAQKYNPLFMMEMALYEVTRTPLTNDRRQLKEYYKNCYKFVKNINKYLIQLLYRENFIQFRKNKKGVTHLIQNLLSFVSQSENEDEEDRQMKRKLIITEIENYLTKDDEVNRWINKQIESLKVSALGCQKQCPLCGMKCILAKDHQGNHRVKFGHHALLAFAGCRQVKTQYFLLRICRSHNSMAKNWYNDPQKIQARSDNCEEFISEYFPDWKLEFTNQVYQYLFSSARESSTPSQEKGSLTFLKQMWANIENVLIATKYIDFKQSVDPQIMKIKDKGFSLNTDDLEEQEIDPTTGKRYRLFDY